MFAAGDIVKLSSETLEDITDMRFVIAVLTSVYSSFFLLSYILVFLIDLTV